MNAVTSDVLQKAYHLIKDGQLDEALALLTPIIRAEPDNADAWYLLGFALTDSEKRLYAFEQVLRLDPSNQHAKKQIAKLHGASDVVLPTTEAALARNARLAQKEMTVVLRWVLAIAALLVCCLVTAAIGVWLAFPNILPASTVASASATVTPLQPVKSAVTLTHAEASPGPLIRPSVTPYPRRATGTPMPATPTVLSPAELVQMLTAAAPTPNMTLVVMKPIDRLLPNSASSEWVSGSLSSGQTISIPFDVDNAGDVGFILTWSKTKPVVFTLTNPEGQMIDAVYSKAHPEIAILNETNLGFTYYVKKSSVGTWKVNLTAFTTSQYEISAHFMQTTLIVRTGSDDIMHAPGEHVNVVVRVEDQGIGVAGAIVTARVKAKHVDFQNVTFVDMGDGFYGLTYQIPKVSNSTMFSVTVRGLNQGVKFTRFTTFLLEFKQ